MKIDYIPVITREYSRKLSVSDIIMIGRNNRVINIVSEKGNFSYYESMDNVCKHLNSNFCRCMKGCVINLDKVDWMCKHEVHFSNGKKLMLARDAFTRAKKAYNEYLKNEDV